MTTATKPQTRTVHIEGTQAATIRCTARVDQPEYGIKAGDVFYLTRSSKNDGTYYICTWNYTAIAWQCSCPATIQKCRHIRTVSALCHERKQQQQTAQTEAANRKRAADAARKAREELAALEAQLEQQAANAAVAREQALAEKYTREQEQFEAQCNAWITNIEKRLAIAGLMR